MKKEIFCDDCGEELESLKKAKRINGNKFCKYCYKKLIETRRKDLIDSDSELKEDIRILKNKEAREYRAKKLGIERPIGRPPTENKAEKKGYIPKRYYIDNSEPKIKGSKEDTKKEKSNAYLSLGEKQNLLRILMSKGVNFEESKERIKNLISEQARVRNEMKEKNKSEEDIKTKQQEMLEELWRY